MSTADNPNLQTSSPAAFVHDPSNTPLYYVVTHVFLPLQPPDTDDHTTQNGHLLASAMCTAAHTYGTHICGTSEQAQWHRITKVLDNLQASIQSEHTDDDHLISQLRVLRSLVTRPDHWRWDRPRPRYAKLY